LVDAVITLLSVVTERWILSVHITAIIPALVVLVVAVVISITRPSRSSISIINYKVPIILHDQLVRSGSFVPSVRSPDGLIIPVIDNKVPIFLHDQLVRSGSFPI